MKAKISNPKMFVIMAFIFICISTASCASPTPTIHATDLWRPHGDPDDHWDLATQYALAYKDLIELKCILIDHPMEKPPVKDGKPMFGDPDVIGIAMMNIITSKTPTVIFGSPKQTDKSTVDNNGTDQILEILRSSAAPVVIHITGSSRDIAIAGKKVPELFAQKCKAIYLNAGWAKGASWECNVNYDPNAFDSIFNLPCPIYWLPCSMTYDHEKKTIISKGQFASEYSLLQKDVLPLLSTRCQNFFAYMYRDGHYQKPEKPYNSFWMAYLNGPIEKDVIDYHSQHIRGMWCTAGFLHAAGKTVTKDGKIVPLDKAPKDAVFTFDPIEIKNKTPREINWNPTSKPTNRFIIHIKNQQDYEKAMNQAVKTLLLSLP